MKRLLKYRIIYLLGPFVLIFVLSCNRILVNECTSLSSDIPFAYIVDTIYIEDPIVIIFQNTYYVLEKKYCDNNNDVKKSINSNNCFILSFDFYYDFPKLFEQHHYLEQYYPDKGDCKLKRISPETLIFDKKPCFFILSVINARFYEKKHNSIDAPIKIDYGHQRNSYIKVVYPVCCE